jgi:peptidoglycan hydrolase CwlO-like protein
MINLQKSIENKQSQIDKLNRDIEELKKDLQTKDLIKIVDNTY